MTATGGRSASQTLESLPILAAEVQPKPGFYHTLLEFEYNEPSEPGRPEVEARPYSGTEWAGAYEIKAYRCGPTSQRVLGTDDWGFCDGERVKIRRGPSFYRLVRRGQQFVFLGRKGESAGLHAAHTAASVLSLASALRGGGSAYVGTGVAEHPALFYVDLLSGTVSLDQLSTPAATGLVINPTHLFIYRLRNAKGPTIRIRLAEGQPAQELVAGDYLSLFPDKNQPVRIYLLAASGAETYFDMTPAAEACTYLEYRPTPGTPLRLVPYTEGSAALNRLAR